jgi:hypothetical protein
MKLVKEHINEFKQGGDPYKTMGLGIWTKDNWIPKVEKIILKIYGKPEKFEINKFDHNRSIIDTSYRMCFDNIDLYFYPAEHEYPGWSCYDDIGGPNETEHDTQGDLDDFEKLEITLEKAKINLENAVS